MNVRAFPFSPKIGGETEGVENLTIYTYSTSCHTVKDRGYHTLPSQGMSAHDRGSYEANMLSFLTTYVSNPNVIL